jgi:hypothetical protein
MSSDYTEAVRREQVVAINSVEGSREYLEQEHGNVWDTREMQERFEVLGFMAPYCLVRRKSDGVKGSILFQHNPRFYFMFEEK